MDDETRTRKGADADRSPPLHDGECGTRSSVEPSLSEDGSFDHAVDPIDDGTQGFSSFEPGVAEDTTIRAVESVSSSGFFDVGGMQAHMLANLFEAFPLPAWLMDESGTVITANKSCERIGAGAAAIRNKNFSSLFANPKAASKACNLVRSVLEDGVAYSAQARFRTGSKSSFVRMNFRPLKLDGRKLVLLIIEDLTAEKDQLLVSERYRKELTEEQTELAARNRQLKKEIAERELVEEELRKTRDQLESRVRERAAELLRSNAELRREVELRREIEAELDSSRLSFSRIIEKGTDGVLVVSREGEVLFASQAAQRLLGRPADTLVGSHFGFPLVEGEMTEIDLVSPSGELGLAEMRVASTDWHHNPAYIVMLRDVTELRQAQERLRESEEKYRLLFSDVLHPIILFDALTAKIIDANDATLNLFGYPRDRFLGLHAHDIVADQSEDFPAVGPKDDDGGTRIHLLKKSDGSVFVSETTTSLFHWKDTDILCSVLKDITDQRVAQQSLKQSREQLQLIIDALPVGIGYVDPLLRVQFINKTLKNWWAIAEDPSEPLRIEQLLGNYYFSQIRDRLRIALSGQESIYEERVTFRDGITRDVRVILVPHVGTDGQTVGVVAQVTDLTDLKEAEQRMLRSERLSAVGELSSGVAHNFNNLLQIVMGNAQLALAAIDDGELQEARTGLHRITSSCKVGSHTVKRLQRFARTSSDRPKSSVFDLSSTVAQAVEMSKVWWKNVPEKEGISVHLTQDLEPGCYVRGSESDMFEVVINLIKNASEALPQGGTIDVSTKKVGDHMTLVVRDSGVGIADDCLGKVFQPFFTTKGFQSTGMGLASSHGIVQSHGGEIAVESALGEGTAFVVALPRAEDTDTEEVEEVLQTKGLSLGILVVDDMDAVVSLLDKGLTRMGHRVFAAQSGPEALAVLDRNRIDVVICDLAMPGMNGWEIGRRMKDLCLRRNRPKTPFIIFTGWDDEKAERDRMIDSGVDAIIEKPVDILRLMEVVAEVYKGRESQP